MVFGFRLQNTIGKAQYNVGALHNGDVVCDDDDAHIAFVCKGGEQRDDVVAVFSVEVSGRLVG